MSDDKLVHKTSFLYSQRKQAPLAPNNRSTGLTTWLNKQKPSPSRDQAVSRFIDLLSDSDPDTAQEWAETIHDDSLKKRAIQKLKTK